MIMCEVKDRDGAFLLKRVFAGNQYLISIDQERKILKFIVL